MGASQTDFQLIQDVFSIETWHILTDSFKVSIAQPELIINVENPGINNPRFRLDPPEIVDELFYHFIASIELELKDYHSIPKTSLEHIDQRIDKLDSIQKIILSYISSRKAGHDPILISNNDDLKTIEKRRVSDNSFKGNEQFCYKYTKGINYHIFNTPNLKLGSFDNWIHQLLMTTERKAHYLTDLKKYYAQFSVDKPLPSKQELTDLIKSSYPKPTEVLEERQSLFPYMGCLIEAIDPAHIPHEFNDAELKKYLKNKKFSANSSFPANEIFFQWVASDSEVDYFLWREAHPRILATRAIDAEYKMLGNVNYKPEHTYIANIDKNEEGCYLVCTHKNDDENSIILDTAEIVTKSKCDFGTTKKLPAGFDPTKTIAFLWLKKDNVFLIGPHQQYYIHHPSYIAQYQNLNEINLANIDLLAVDCAGLWTVEQGKITAINNISGHFRPTAQHFADLIVTLYRQGLFAENAIVASFESKDFKIVTTVREYLKIVRPEMNCTFEKNKYSSTTEINLKLNTLETKHTLNRIPNTKKPIKKIHSTSQAAILTETIPSDHKHKLVSRSSPIVSKEKKATKEKWSPFWKKEKKNKDQINENGMQNISKRNNHF